jgi:hypothetical protein
LGGGQYLIFDVNRITVVVIFAVTIGVTVRCQARNTVVNGAIVRVIVAASAAVIVTILVISTIHSCGQRQLQLSVAVIIIITVITVERSGAVSGHGVAVSWIVGRVVVIVDTVVIIVGDLMAISVSKV